MSQDNVIEFPTQRKSKKVSWAVSVIFETERNFDQEIAESLATAIVNSGVDSLQKSGVFCSECRIELVADEVKT